MGKLDDLRTSARTAVDQLAAAEERITMARSNVLSADEARRAALVSYIDDETADTSTLTKANKDVASALQELETAWADLRPKKPKPQ